MVGANKAILTFMCGGSPDSFVKAKPFLDLMGKRAIHCGPSGSGLAAKIANNLLLAISMVGTAEAMLLGQRFGLDPALLATVINSSSGRCWSSEVNNPAPGALPVQESNVPANRRWTGGFASRLMAKDLSLALRAATDLSIESALPITKMVREMYKDISNDPGMETKDFSVVYRWLEKLAQEESRKLE